MIDLFSPFDLAGLALPNRIVMAPMTRARGPEDIADERIALYYAQRATAGLIVTEGTPVSREGQGYLFNPGIFSPRQMEDWRLTTQSVRSAGGRMFVQLWHVGRVSHVSIQQDDASPVGPSTRRADAMTFGRGADGKLTFVPASMPRMLATDEVARIVRDFAQAARNAVEAGFDGVEIHGASGYILEQFLNPAVNDRTDRYGGTREKRMRFALDVVDAVSDAVGRRRVGIRLSPWGTINGNGPFEDKQETNLALGRELGARRIVYAHITNQTVPGAWPKSANDAVLHLLRTWRPVMPETALILAGGMDRGSADALLGDGVIDLAAFGRPFIANPDLPARLRHGWPLAVADSDTYYAGGAHGYIDYPPHAAEPVGQLQG